MNIIIFDTETVGIQTQSLLNVGYKIIDINPDTAEIAKIHVKRDYIVREHYNNEMLMLNDMFVGAVKWEQYKENVRNGGAILRSTEQILNTMLNDITRYHAEFGYAYNCAFDIDKITKSANTYGAVNPIATLPIFDIWGYAYDCICVTDDYKKYCIEHDLLTESQRFIQTSVEGVTAYLTKNPKFKEDHTALSDVEWEIRILQECIRRGADIQYPVARGKNISSNKVFSKTLVINGEEIEVNYTKTIGKFDSSDKIKFVNEL